MAFSGPVSTPVYGGNATTATTYTINLSSGANVGELLVVCGTNYAVEYITGISLTGVTTWTMAAQVELTTGGFGTAEIWYGLVTTTISAGTNNATITLAASTPGLNAYGMMSRWTGVNLTSPLDTTSTNANQVVTGTANEITPSLSLAAGGELIIAVINQATGDSSVWTNGFTDLSTAWYTNNGGFSDTAYLIDASGGTISTAVPAGTSGHYSTAIAAFKSSAVLLTAAISPSASLSTTAAKKVALSSALAPSLSLSGSVLPHGPLGSTAITPLSSVAATAKEAIALSAAVSPSLALTGAANASTPNHGLMSFC